jgi:hypothetical protein
MELYMQHFALCNLLVSQLRQNLGYRDFRQNLGYLHFLDYQD